MIAQLEVERVDETTIRVFLDADQKSPAAKEFEAKLSNRIVGQDRAVRHTSGLYQIFLAGMNPSNRPVGTMLFLGPTGSGKTRVVEAAEVLFGDPHAIVKIDCAEFQHSHEIAKLIASSRRNIQRLFHSLYRGGGRDAGSIRADSRTRQSQSS
jgi:ATP-dependent Clp protease ATP-binding subunit ClpA